MKEEFEVSVIFTATKGNEDYASAQFDWSNLDKAGLVMLEEKFLKVITDLNSMSKASLDV